MSTGYGNFSNTDRCPICGKPDWCAKSYIPDSPNLFQIICFRSESEYDVSGYDGRTYAFIRTNNNGNNVYEEEQQLKQRRKEYAIRMSGGKPYKSSAAPAIIQQSYIHIEPETVPIRPNHLLHPIYSDLMKLLSLDSGHIKTLKTNDHWTNEMILTSGVKSFPENDMYRFSNKGSYFTKSPSRKRIVQELVKKYGDLTGVPGFYKRDGEWALGGLGGLMFPQYDFRGNIFSLRYKPDKNEFEGQKFKYLNLGSPKESLNMDSCGCRAGNNVGVYLKAGDDTSICIIVEGEKKGYIANQVLNCLILNITGASNFNLLIKPDCYDKRPIDYLHDFGTEYILSGLDADKKYNRAVLKNEKKLINVLLNEDFELGLLSWDILNGKGLDDLLINGGKPDYEFVLDF